MKRAAPLSERIAARLVADPETGCLLWTGQTAKGYGQIRVGSRTDGTRRTVYVHRLVWELENGPIPAGLTIDHVKARGCRHTTCANVAHLEPVTIQENIFRARRTHCLRGHALTEANTRDRRCITCHNSWRARAIAARAAA